MEWKLFANLAEAAGQKEVEIDLDGGATVDDALAVLFDRHPELKAEVHEDGELAEHIRLLVDGEDPFETADGYETTLERDAELALFPPVSGG
ncbi:ubiquitin-like small modifier protein 1 [Halapricum desulfuricans]|uniref:Molybdopterin converting factor, small subunit n=1 Tax=Halapricum desulfuricans TaxID=2841257 RepID=A0A897N8Y6_9EURY|nr:ubiquitin-like small modifier protein 1 [Halapricum desulfuricans]QSG09147.1 Molybdopterin converting factor, small subunit [Halapricum desulfuricans]QSG12124.1 Molybdopterin converting factor, small subunit [Halapricum desulfuricans]